MTTPLTDAEIEALELVDKGFAKFGNEDADNPHLITAGRDEDDAFLYPEFYADDPSGTAMITLRNSLRAMLDEIKASRAKIKRLTEACQRISDAPYGVALGDLEFLNAALAEPKEAPKP